MTQDENEYDDNKIAGTAVNNLVFNYSTFLSSFTAIFSLSSSFTMILILFSFANFRQKEAQVSYEPPELVTWKKLTNI